MKTDIRDMEDIKKLVDSFYAAAGQDDLLGSIFLQLNDANSHKVALYTYWEAALLNDQTSRQEKFPGHIELMFSPQHFMRWLTLFMQAIDNLYSGPNAEKAKVIVIRKSEEFQASLEIFRF